MFTLQNSTHRHCVQLVLTEDELVTATVGLVLSLELTFNDSSATIILEPAEISFTLLDNDGKFCTRLHMDSNYFTIY